MEDPEDTEIHAQMPMAKDTLDSMADLVGIERQEGETDEKLRKRIIEIVKKKGVSKP